MLFADPERVAAARTPGSLHSESSSESSSRSLPQYPTAWLVHSFAAFRAVILNRSHNDAQSLGLMVVTKSQSNVTPAAMPKPKYNALNPPIPLMRVTMSMKSQP
jgi:hypothetical protein